MAAENPDCTGPPRLPLAGTMQRCAMRFKNSKCAASRVSSSRRQFLALIQHFESEADKKNDLSTDERHVLRRLSSDERMQTAWELLAKLDQEWFDAFIDNLLNSRAYCVKVLPRERNIYRTALSNIARIRQATKHLRRVSLIAIVTDASDVPDEPLRKEREPEPYLNGEKFEKMLAREHTQRTLAGKHPQLLEILEFIERDLKIYEQKARVEQAALLQQVSRKSSFGESTEFMREMAQLIKSFFQKPHYEIVADITTVVLNLERDVSADAARKADLIRKKRTIERSEKRE